MNARKGYFSWPNPPYVFIVHLKGRRCQDGKSPVIGVAKTRSRSILVKGMDTQTKYIRLHREDIAYFKFIIESYEGMAVVRTKDPYEAVVELMVAPGWEKDLEEVLEGLRKEITFENMSNFKFQNLPL